MGCGRGQVKERPVFYGRAYLRDGGLHVGWEPLFFGDWCLSPPLRPPARQCRGREVSRDGGGDCTGEGGGRANPRISLSLLFPEVPACSCSKGKNYYNDKHGSQGVFEIQAVKIPLAANAVRITLKVQKSLAIIIRP